jgi:cysteine synthase A
MELVNYEKANNLNAALLGKLEYFNPTGSIKDRAAINMILAAEKEGKLHPGDTIVENTSGNTGIGLAAFAAARGYKLEVFLELGQSVERQMMLKAYGAKLNLMTDLPEVAKALGEGTFTVPFYMDQLQQYCDRQESNYFFINQLLNQANPDAHYTGTGPEIWEDTDGKVDILVALAGTAGTITGLSRYFREKNPDVYVCAVQPAVASRVSAENPHPNTIDGVVPFDGEGFPDTAKPPFIIDFHYDECMDVVAEDAYETGRQLAQTDGLFLGQSAAAAVYAATVLARRPENAGKNIVVILPDNGMKYLSTNMYKLEEE